jgi:beta-glucosidase
VAAGIKAGSITEAAVNASVMRMLTPMYRIGVMDAPEGTWSWEKLSSNVSSAKNVVLARQLSAASTVLLKNEDDTLPLAKGTNVAVIGFGSDNAVVHGGGSGSVVPSYVARPLDGIIAESGPAAKVTFNDGTDVKAAVEAAKAADVAVVFVATLSHEGGDRKSLSLDDGCDGCGGPAANQNALVEAVAAANPKTVVVISCPGAVLTPWRNKVVR